MKKLKRSRPTSVEGSVAASYCCVLRSLYMGIYTFVHGFVVSRYFSHSNFYIISLRRRKLSALLILSTKKQRQSICNFNGCIYLLLMICFIAMFTCL